MVINTIYKHVWLTAHIWQKILEKELEGRKDDIEYFKLYIFV